MNLEVGMYIRTDEGFIAKVKEFKHDYTKGKRLVDDYSVKEVVENYLSLDGNQCRLIESIDYSIPPCYPSDEELDEIKSHILKASYNIIDVLEVGDVIEIDVIDEDNYPTIMGINFARIDNKVELASIKDMLKNESAKLLTVTTHEQMEQIAYKVGD